MEEIGSVGGDVDVVDIMDTSLLLNGIWCGVWMAWVYACVPESLVLRVVEAVGEGLLLYPKVGRLMSGHSILYIDFAFLTRNRNGDMLISFLLKRRNRC